MISLVTLLCFVILFLILQGFFSGSEAVYLSVNRPRLFRKAKENFPGALLAKKLLLLPEHLFSTTVVGTTLCVTLSSTLVTLFIMQEFGYEKEWLTLITLTPVMLLFGEFIPKLFGRSQTETLAPKLARPIQLAGLILSPISQGFVWYSKALRRLLGETSEKGFFLSREEIKAGLAASRGTDVTAAERQLIERVLEFNRISVKEMLRPLIEVVAIEETQTVEEAVKLLVESGHSRIPVYQERIDRIVGVLSTLHCLNAPDLKAPIKSIMESAYFVPDSQSLDDLYVELKTRPMAIAVNEFGGAEGIITMEDVMEEIVGEIEDEYDDPPKLYHRMGENTYIVNARIEMDDLEDILKLSLPQDDDYQTLGGFLLKKMQKIPKKWDSIVIDQVEYVVQSATDRAIEEVYIIVHKKLT